MQQLIGKLYPAAHLPIIINKGSQPKDHVTFLPRDSVNLTAAFYPFSPPCREGGRWAPVRKVPRNLAEQSWPIRHLANGRQGGAAKGFSEAGSGTVVEVASLPPLTNGQWLA